MANTGMSEHNHNYTFGSPSKGWPVFDPKTGKRIRDDEEDQNEEG